MAWAYSDKCLRLWDAVTGDCLHTLRYNCKGIANSLACSLGNGIVALADSVGMKFVVWNKQSGECVTSVSIANDFGALVKYGLPGKCEAIDDLLIVSLYCRPNNKSNVYNKKGELLMTLQEWNPMGLCCHGNKVVVQAETELRSSKSCSIYKAVSGSIKQMCIADCTYVLQGINDTKMVLEGETGLIIYHYW